VVRRKDDKVMGGRRKESEERRKDSVSGPSVVKFFRTNWKAGSF
jgi:hypothetical protein